MDSTNHFHELNGLAHEHRSLISRFGRGPKIAVPHETVHRAFESVASAHPSSPAAKHDGKILTYAELDAAANQLANHLLDVGLMPKQRVCVVVQRSFQMLVAILAVLKVGCQYVLVDGGTITDEALQHILKDTGSRFALCSPDFLDKVGRLAKEDVLSVVLGANVEAFCAKTSPRVSVSAPDGVYAVYISDNSGMLTGIDVSHRNITNALLLQPDRFGISLGTKVAQVLDLETDMSAWETLACLMNGGTLYMRGSDCEKTLREVDVLFATPTILSKYRRHHFPNITTIVSGGEPGQQTLADEWADSASYYNICGPTEITILNSAHRHSPRHPLTIGKPLPNTSVYVLDENEDPVPFGGKGSMWVGGAGVTRGYINMPQLTAQRYKRDKFINDGSMMFNTGDVVRWRAAGSLDAYERLGDEAEVKGYRVDLDGVAAAIKQFPGISGACAIFIDTTLYGFYSTTTFIDEHDLDGFVRQHLPHYSVPTRWVYVISDLLGANGKPDNSQLERLAYRASRPHLPGRKSSTISTSGTKSLYLPAKLPALPSSDAEKNENPHTPIVISSNLSTFNVSTPSLVEIPDSLPTKKGSHGSRWLRHRLLNAHRRLFSIVVLSNLAVACFILYRNLKDDRYMLADLVTATATNLCVAVLMKCELFINLLFIILCSVPTSWPLVIRRNCAKIVHYRGVHNGCVVASILWYCIFTIGASLEFGKPPDVRCLTLTSAVLTYMLWPFLLCVGYISRRASRGSTSSSSAGVWTSLLRYSVWTTLILFWIQTFFVVRDLAYRVSASHAYLNARAVWLMTVLTIAIVVPWLSLRKVPVRSEVLSPSAIRLWFDYTTPSIGTSVSVAERPLATWHAYPTIRNADGEKGFSLLLTSSTSSSPFASRTISRAPTSIYVRGILMCDVLRATTLFKSIVLVAADAGISHCLSVIIAKKVPCRILWIAANPEARFGKTVVDSVRECDPKALVHDTLMNDEPDARVLALQLWKESAAEAVFVVGGKRFMTGVGYALATRGVPTYGAVSET